MGIASVPTRLNVRLREQERQAVATVASEISTPHRRPATIAEAIRAALSMASEAVKSGSSTLAA